MVSLQPGALQWLHFGVLNIASGRTSEGPFKPEFRIHRVILRTPPAPSFTGTGDVIAGTAETSSALRQIVRPKTGLGQNWVATMEPWEVTPLRSPGSTLTDPMSRNQSLGG